MADSSSPSSAPIHSTLLNGTKPKKQHGLKLNYNIFNKF